MPIKYGLINSVIGFLLIWGIWQIGAITFSPDAMWILVAIIGAGYALFVLNRIGRAVLHFVFNLAPAPPVPKFSMFKRRKPDIPDVKQTRFQRRKSLFDQLE